MKEEYWKGRDYPFALWRKTCMNVRRRLRTLKKLMLIRFDPPNDFAKAIAAELNQAGVFSSVKFVQER